MRPIGAVAAFSGILFFGATSLTAATADPSILTVCADPNNLPFSNRAGEGFENKISELIAHDLHERIRYVWWAQRRGYIRNTLNESQCDLWPGVAAGIERVASTRPYYRSTYVFVSRQSQPFGHLNLDDSRLQTAVIGVQMIGTDANNTPPAHAMADRGLTGNVRGYMLYGDYREKNPPAAIVKAVIGGDIDIGLVWGPLAGYFAGRSTVKLRLEPVTPADDARWPMQFDIAMGVRPADPRLLNQVNDILDRESSRIREILKSFSVPLIPAKS